MSTMSVNNSLASYKDIFFIPFYLGPRLPSMGITSFWGVTNTVYPFTYPDIQLPAYPVACRFSISACFFLIFVMSLGDHACEQ